MGAKPDYEPTKDEIREACEQIQATWSDDEKRRRQGKAIERERYQIPRVVVTLRQI